MKKWFIPLAVIAVLLFAVYSWAKGFNNKAVVLQEDAKTTWSNVESAYQRRNDSEHVPACRRSDPEMFGAEPPGAGAS